MTRVIYHFTQISQMTDPHSYYIRSIRKSKQEFNVFFENYRTLSLIATPNVLYVTPINIYFLTICCTYVCIKNAAPEDQSGAARRKHPPTTIGVVYHFMVAHPPRKGK